jgi:hypothetical protein
MVRMFQLYAIGYQPYASKRASESFEQPVKAAFHHSNSGLARIQQGKVPSKTKDLLFLLNLLGVILFP